MTKKIILGILSYISDLMQDYMETFCRQLFRLFFLSLYFTMAPSLFRLTSHFILT